MYPNMLALIHVYKITNITQNVVLFFFFAPLKDENSTLFKSLTNGELILYTQQKRQSHAFFPQKITSFSPDCKVAQGMENTEYTALEATMVTKKIKKMPNDQ